MRSSIENCGFGAKENVVTVEVWCVLKAMKQRTVMCVPEIITLNQLRFSRKLYGTILTASWFHLIVSVSAVCSVSQAPAASEEAFWEYFWSPSSFGDLHGDNDDLLVCNHPSSTSQVRKLRPRISENMARACNRAHTKREGKHTTLGKHIPTIHLNITPVFTPKKNIFTLSHSVWGLIHWIEADSTDLQKSGSPPFTNVR